MKVLIHAPTAIALERARTDALVFARHNPDDPVRIIADGDGAAAAHEAPSSEADHLLIVCRFSLQSRGLPEPSGVEITPHGTELIGRLQKKGWAYIRT